VATTATTKNKNDEEDKNTDDDNNDDTNDDAVTTAAARMNHPASPLAPRCSDDRLQLGDASGLLSGHLLQLPQPGLDGSHGRLRFNVADAATQSVG
jgi:hypothetical protein